MAMVNESTYTYLLSWLCPAMEAMNKQLYGETYSYRAKNGQTRTYENTLKGSGHGDDMVYQWRVDRLRTIIRKLICEDKTRRFLSDGSKSAIYAFNGVCFVRVEDREIFLKELLKRAFIELDLGEKYNDEYPAKAIAMSCLDTISSSDKYLYRPNRRYVAFRNLVYDLEKFKAVTPKIDQCPAIVLDLEYKDPKDLDIECGQKFKTFDNPRKIWETKIFGEAKGDQLPGVIPNRQVADAFQQWCGSLLADKSRFKVEYTCMLVGPGSNGKSVLANAILNVFGEQYFSCFSLRQLFKDSDRNVNIAALQGKIANFIDDVEDKKMSDDGFKTFASGGEFQGRVPYDKRPIKVKAPPLLCCANSVPETDDDSFGAHRRRLVLHTTQHRFVGDERDTSLTYKLSQPEARMYIFHWIVEGYRKFVKNGGDIVLKPEVAKAQEIVMAGSNNMRRWWAENDYEAVKEYDKDCWRSLAELYDEYKAFAEAEGSKRHARPELSAMLAQKGCFKQRLQVGYGFCLRKSKSKL